MNRHLTRTWLRLAVTALIASTGIHGAAHAQGKPVVRVLVGFPPGSGSDNLARIYADALSTAIGVSAVVDNRPGAGGQIAAQALKSAPPESNSLMFTVDHQVVMLPLVTKSPGFEVAKDMVPVARIANFYTCLVVPASSPARTLEEYIEGARRNPAMANVAIPAPGSQPHFATYLVGQKYKVDLTAVPYKGWAPAMADLVGGNVPAAVGPCDALTEHQKAGRVRVLAAATTKRLKFMPAVPTFAEHGIDLPADSFLAVYASNTLRPELLRQVTEATRRMFDDPAVVERIAGTQMEPAYAGPDELRRIVEQNTTFWGEQVRRSQFQAQ